MPGLRSGVVTGDKSGNDLDSGGRRSRRNVPQACAARKRVPFLSPIIAAGSLWRSSGAVFRKFLPVLVTERVWVESLPSRKRPVLVTDGLAWLFRPRSGTRKHLASPGDGVPSLSPIGGGVGRRVGSSDPVLVADYGFAWIFIRIAGQRRRFPRKCKRCV